MKRARLLVGRLGLTGFVILLTGTALVFLAGRTAAGELLTNLRLPLGLGGLAAALCLAAGQWRRKEALVALASAMALVHLWPTAALYLGEPQSAAPGPELRVAVVNLRFGRADPVLLEHFSQEFRPDVLGLLEVLTPNRGGTDWDARLLSWRERFPHQEVMPYGRLFQMALLSRYPILRAQRGEVSDTLGGFLADPPLMEAILDVEGRQVRVLLTHTHRPGSSLRHRARQVSFEALASTDFDGPRVVLGDLNTTGTSPFFRELLERGGLVDTRPSFGACLSWSPGGLLCNILCLDHILVGGGLGVALRGTGSDIGSDHLPATAVLRFAGRRSDADFDAQDRNPPASGTVVSDRDGVPDPVDQR